MITDRDIPFLRRLLQQAFGDSDAFLDIFFSLGFSPERCRCIREDGKPVAALYWFDCDWKGKKAAYIYAVATHTAHRGKGLCRRLMEDTHAHLQAHGYAGAALVPADKGLSALYAKFGYRDFCPIKKAAAENIPAATAIEKAEYAQLRQKLAGENALLHSDTALGFLAAYGEFYKTENGIFCGYREGARFRFEEALGVAVEEEAFPVCAMYLPLDGEDTLPDYFAISLN